MTRLEFRELLHNSASTDENFAPLRRPLSHTLPSPSSLIHSPQSCQYFRFISDSAYLRRLAVQGFLFISPEFFHIFWTEFSSVLPIFYLRPEFSSDLKLTMATITAHICIQFFKQTRSTEIQSATATRHLSRPEFIQYLLVIVSKVLLTSNSPSGFDSSLVKQLLLGGSDGSIFPSFFGGSARLARLCVSLFSRLPMFSAV
jgi:hypothetical protein